MTYLNQQSCDLAEALAGATVHQVETRITPSDLGWEYVFHTSRGVTVLTVDRGYDDMPVFTSCTHSPASEIQLR